jgi:hypothetical protein
MVPRIMAIGLGVIALISAITFFGTAIGNTRDRTGFGSGASTRHVCASADRELASKARDIDRASVGETGAAGFLASEFGMSEEAIIAEKKDFGASWGNLTIAHTLAASDKQGMTAAQVLQLHDRGMGWGQVAAALHFKLDDVLKAVDAESRVASGRAKADGKTAPVGTDASLVLSDRR